MLTDQLPWAEPALPGNCRAVPLPALMADPVGDLVDGMLQEFLGQVVPRELVAGE